MYNKIEYWHTCYATYLKEMYNIYKQKVNNLKSTLHIETISYTDFCVLVYNQSNGKIYSFDER